MQQPKGYEDSVHPDWICLLQQALYGPKQSPRQWFALLRSFLLSLHFTQSDADLTLFVKHTGSDMFFVVVYVDDLTLATNSKSDLQAFKASMTERFEMKDLGELTHYLGLEVSRDRVSRTLSLSQARYVEAVLDRFSLSDCNPISTPLEANHTLTRPDDSPPFGSPKLYQQLVGSLMYLMVCTRPDIAYAVSVLSRYVAEGRCKEQHWAAGKRVLKYLKGTQAYRLILGGDGPITLKCFSDSSWGDDHSTRRSTQGYS